MLGKRLTLIVLATTTGLFIITRSAAALTELRFSEAQMPLGTSASVVSLSGGEYTGYGITTFNAYRYSDGRDPFSDGVENSPSGPWGLSMDTFSSLARVNLLNPTSSLEIDWWT